MKTKEEEGKNSWLTTIELSILSGRGWSKLWRDITVTSCETSFCWHKCQIFNTQLPNVISNHQQKNTQIRFKLCLLLMLLVSFHSHFSAILKPGWDHIKITFDLIAHWCNAACLLVVKPPADIYNGMAVTDLQIETLLKERKKIVESINWNTLLLHRSSNKPKSITHLYSGGKCWSWSRENSPLARWK